MFSFEDNYEIDLSDESVDFDSYEPEIDQETDVDIQPVTNCCEFILLVLMYPSFFTRNLN
jgi:hypothetical protein